MFQRPKEVLLYLISMMFINAMALVTEHHFTSHVRITRLCSPQSYSQRAERLCRLVLTIPTTMRYASRVAELNHELPEITSRRIFDVVFQFRVVLLVVLRLHSF